jgi:hypothetical protein
MLFYDTIPTYSSDNFLEQRNGKNSKCASIVLCTYYFYNTSEHHNTNMEAEPKGRHYGMRMDLLLAGDAGDIGLVRELMKAPRADVNKAFSHAKFNKRSTALHYASRSGHLALVKVLVDEFGANIDAREKEDWTPVYYAANNGFVPCPPGN